MKKVNRRLKYLGFDDKWFMIIGILVLSFAMDYLFNQSFARKLPWIDALIGWSVSLFFSVFYWIVTREVLIRFRKRFPSIKDSVKRIISFTIVFIGSILLVNYVGSYFLVNAVGINFNPKSTIQYLLPIIFVSLMTMAIYEAIYFYIQLKSSIREEEQAKQAIVQVQLDALRNQAQPHFLFNTLNTLRDIIDQNTKEEAKDFVNKIAAVYRFILESGNANLVLLKDEIKFSQAYIHIQKERFGDNLLVEWSVPEIYEDRLIVPMSLQVLLENAIKHNVVSASHPLKISVEVIDDKLMVVNDIREKSTQLPSTKKGLENIQKRYELISQEPVVIDKQDGKFSVMVPLLKTNFKEAAHASLNY